MEFLPYFTPLLASYVMFWFNKGQGWLSLQKNVVKVAIYGILTMALTYVGAAADMVVNPDPATWNETFWTSIINVVVGTLLVKVGIKTNKEKPK